MNTQQIREWLILNVFKPLAGVRGLEITLKAGNIHHVLGLQHRQPMVCQVLRKVADDCAIVVLIEERPGEDVLGNPPTGANVWYTYRIQ